MLTGVSSHFGHLKRYLSGALLSTLCFAQCRYVCLIKSRWQRHVFNVCPLVWRPLKCSSHPRSGPTARN